MKAESDVVRAGESAEILGVEPRQVYDAIDAGDLPARHLEGHGIRLDRADLEAYAGSSD